MRYCFALLIGILFSISATAQTSYQTTTRLYDRADTSALGEASVGSPQLDCPTTLLLGQNLAFNGSFSNSGTVPIEGAFFRMTVNTRLSLTQGSTTQGTWSGTAQQLQLNMGTVAPGQQVTFDLTIDAVMTGTASIETVFGFDGGSDTPESCEFEVIDQSDLYIDKFAVVQEPVIVGDEFVYGIAVGNAGPHTATNVVIQDALPPEVDVLDVTINGGPNATGATCDVNNDTLTCQMTSFGVTTQESELAIISVQVRALMPGMTENQATVSAETSDPNPENNESPVIVVEIMEPTPMLEIRKAASAGPNILLGSAFSYTVTVTNTGSATATAVMMTDNLPNTVTVTSVTPSPGASCTQNGLTLNCNLGDIDPGEVVTVLINVLAASVGNATNFANIDGGSANVEISIVETQSGSNEIRGQKFLDRNGNGVKDAGEPGMNGVTIELLDATGALIAQQVTGSEDLNGDMRIDPETEQGLFRFQNVEPGMYTLREVVPLFMAQTFPAPPGTHAVRVDEGVPLDNFLFGNRFLPIGDTDFGDLPDPRMDSHCPVGGGYFTLLGSNGPFHIIDEDKAILGTLIDDELNGQPDAAALGDDLNNTMADDDEDGLLSMSILADGTIRFDILATVPPGEDAFVDVWVDLDDNCSFEQLAPPLVGGFDYVLVREPVVDGVNVLTTDPGLADPDDVLGYTRIRISSTGTPFPTGGADDGEVEDYYLIGVDFGDAPGSIDPDRPDFPGGYPTTLAQDGARHIAVSNVRLGDLIDVEGLADGSFDALEDDENRQQDDEDGIVFLDGFAVTMEMIGDKEIEVVKVAQDAEALLLPLPSTNGRLDAWIDFNRDGDWEDDGEQIFDREPINPQMDEDDALSVKVPGDADLGYTYARFRFSRNGGLSFQGGAPDGEVEDVLLEVISDIGTAIKQAPEQPIAFTLYTAYPNPFNPSTTLRFDLPEDAEVRVEVFDVLGRQVLVLPIERMGAGTNQTLHLDASALTSGLYLYRLTAQGARATHTATGRLMLVK